MSAEGERVELAVPTEAAGERLDRFLAATLTDYSRTYLARLLREGCGLVDGARVKPSHRLRGGERIALEIRPREEEAPVESEDIPLAVLYEDEAIIVVDKPAGMVVHPGCGHRRGTLAGALLAHCGALSGAGGPARPGVVHRLDRETSGVLVAARTDAAHRALSRQFAERTVRKEYLALVHGAPRDCEGLVTGAIRRHAHPAHRKEMTVAEDGRPSETRYEVAETFGRARGGPPGGGGVPRFARIRAFPRTGRTHQVRVHLASLGCPVLCDPVYGRERAMDELHLRGERPRQGAEPARIVLARHALHAHRLEIAHPVSGGRLAFEAPVPEDLGRVLARLRELPRGRDAGRC